MKAIGTVDPDFFNGIWSQFVELYFRGIDRLGRATFMKNANFALSVIKGSNRRTKLRRYLRCKWPLSRKCNPGAPDGAASPTPLLTQNASTPMPKINRKPELRLSVYRDSEPGKLLANERDRYAQHCAYANQPTLWCQNALRQAMHVTGCSREAPLPDAWRRRGLSAPRGNKNALRYRRYTKEAIVMRRTIRELVRQSRGLLATIK